MRPNPLASLAIRGLVAGALVLGCGDGEDTTLPGDQMQGPPACTPTVEASGGLRQIELPARDDAGGLDLRGWDLSCANLSRVYLSGADLRGANLSSSLLQFTGLAGANLQDATLAHANLDTTDLTDADLTHANLTDANLTGSFLSDADLSGADLTNAIVNGVIFTWARAVDLVACPLTREYPAYPRNPMPGATTFKECVATGDTFTLIGMGMDHRGADLSGVDLADIVGARAFDLRSCPDLTDYPDYSCVRQPATDGWALVGPSMSVLGADFTGIDLSGVRMVGRLLSAGFTGLNECPAKLSPELRCAQLPDTSSARALLGPGVDLSEVSLPEFDLLGADLSGADLSNAVLPLANFTDVSLGGAELDGLAAFFLPACPTELPASWSCVRGGSYPYGGGRFALVGPGAALGGCPGDNYEAKLAGVDLAGQNLAGATMQFVTLSQANLADADLSGTILSGADLSGADLSGADLSGAVLGPHEYAEEFCSYSAPGANLEGAILADVVWSDTSCPDGSNSDDHQGTCEGFLDPAL